MQNLINDAQQKMQKAVEYLQEEFAKLQTGRANAALVDSVIVESYGARSPLKAVASISVPEANQIAIQPWDRSQLQAIEKAIMDAKLGLNPQNDGIVIRLIIPPLTEERRRDIVKTVHSHAEEARISIRNARHENLNQLKAMEKAGELTEDDLRGAEKSMQKLVDDFNAKVQELSNKKEAEVMQV